MEDLQSGVRKDEPAAPTRRWKDTIKALAEENAEEMVEYLDEQSDVGDINVLSDDVAYAQKHFVINNSDWLNPDTGKYVCMMPLCELMQLRQ
eukprot:4544452-Heterocapsa_arctica.AAC.1